MVLLSTYLLTLVVAQAAAIGIGLAVERYYSPYTGLMVFIPLYFVSSGWPGCSPSASPHRALASAVASYFGCTLGLPPGEPGGGMILSSPPPGGGTLISGSTPAGGQITPFESASRSLGLGEGGPPTVGGGV